MVLANSRESVCEAAKEIKFVRAHYVYLCGRTFVRYGRCWRASDPMRNPSAEFALVANHRADKTCKQLARSWSPPFRRIGRT